jgi:hypothetical protein
MYIYLAEESSAFLHNGNVPSIIMKEKNIMEFFASTVRS